MKNLALPFRKLSTGFVGALTLVWVAGCSDSSSNLGSTALGPTSQGSTVRDSNPNIPPAPPPASSTEAASLSKWVKSGAAVASRSSTVRQSGQPYQISFQPGWNLFAMPFSTPTTFTVNGTVLSCYSYNAVTGAYVPQTFSQAGFTPQSGSTSNSYQGFWVFCSTPTTLSVNGDTSTQNPLQTSLVSGWNLVGTPTSTDVTASGFQFNSESLTTAANNTLLGPEAFTYSTTSGGYQALSYQSGVFPAFQAAWVFAYQPGTLSTAAALTGNTAIQAPIVAGYQAFQGALNYPLLQVGATLPVGSRFNPGLARAVQKQSNSLDYTSMLDLYSTDFVVSGNTLSDSFYLDAAGTQTAGNMTITYPPGTTISSPGQTSATPPYNMTLAANITGGTLPMVGTGSITLFDSAGAGEIRGTLCLPATLVALTSDLSLDDQGNISGTASLNENGQTIIVSNITGAFFSGNLTGNVTVAPQGYTGNATVSLDGTFLVTLNTPSGVATGTMGLNGLTITYPDSSQQTLPDPLTAQPGSTPVVTTPVYNTPLSLGATSNFLPNAINNNGLIVGQNGKGGAYLTSPTAQLQALAVYQSYVELPTGLNNNGEILGYGGDLAPVVVWPTPTSTPVSFAGVPDGLNDNGQIVGAYGGLGGYWSSLTAQPTTLNALPGDDTVIMGAINNAGLIVGLSYASQSGQYQPVYWTNSTASPQALPGGLSPNWYTTFGVNDNGQIFACSPYGNTTTTLFWTNVTTAPVTLPSLPNATITEAYVSGAVKMTSSGVLVGTSQNSTGQPRAVIWQNGQVQDLNDLIPSGTNWTLQYATGINDSGAIVGWGTNGTTNYTSFYLTPYVAP